MVYQYYHIQHKNFDKNGSKLSITDLPMEILVLIYHLLDKFSKWALVNSCRCLYNTLYLEEKEGLYISINELWIILAQNNFLSVMDKLSKRSTQYCHQNWCGKRLFTNDYLGQDERLSMEY